MHDDDTKGSVVGERPEAAAGSGAKRPTRARSARSRLALSDLAFFISEGLRADGIAPMTRAKLLAWAAIYGAK